MPSNVSGYHSSTPRWRQGGYRTPDPANYVGIEIETYNSNGRSRTAQAVDDAIRAGLDLLVEEDGSLSRDYGAELILPPRDRNELFLSGGVLDSLYQRLVSEGCSQRPGDGYGMHFTMDFPDETGYLWKVVRYIVNNFRPMGEVIARRNQNHYCMYSDGIGLFNGATSRGNNGNTEVARQLDIPNAVEKYRAARTRSSSILEFRFARGMLDLVHTANCVAYVTSIRGWIISEGTAKMAAVCLLSQHIERQQQLRFLMNKFYGYLVDEGSPLAPIFKDAVPGIVVNRVVFDAWFDATPLNTRPIFSSSGAISNQPTYNLVLSDENNLRKKQALTFLDKIANGYTIRHPFSSGSGNTPTDASVIKYFDKLGVLAVERTTPVQSYPQQATASSPSRRQSSDVAALARQASLDAAILAQQARRRTGR